MAKYRLDDLLVRRGFCEDKNQAQAWVMAGEVIVNDHRIDKAGERFKDDVDIRLRPRKSHKYVSRGGLKLEGAIASFDYVVSNKVCADLGASTGGFTDCLLNFGAQRVYAIDVGYGLLDWRLRQDERVINLERTHAAHLTRDQIPESIDLLVADISFNSLTRILEPVMPFMKDKGALILLIKPQFEASREDVGPGGIVSDPAVHEQVCGRIRQYLEGLGASIMGVVPSPILGGHGNKEFLIGAELKG